MSDSVIDHLINGAITLVVVFVARLWSRNEHLQGQMAGKKIGRDVTAIKNALNGSD